MLDSECPHLCQNVKAEGIDGLSVQVVPGVPSVMAAAASSGVPLVSQGQRLAILPEVYEQCSPELLRRLGFGLWNATGGWAARRARSPFPRRNGSAS